MINGISLFANVGISEIYLKECGINIVVANELINERAKFYKHVYPKCEMIVGDITKEDIYSNVIKVAKLKKCKFLIATPPCQGMSVAGKRDYSDSRNYLIIKVIDAIKDLNPDYVIIENVPQQLKTEIFYNDSILTIEQIISKEFSHDYKINKNKVLNTEDYGIPQSRKRSIILMSKFNQWEFPKKEQKKITVREAIGGLPSVEAVIKESEKRNVFPENEKRIEECIKVHKWHIPKTHPWRHVEAMMHTPTGRSAFDNSIYYPKKTNGERVKGYNTTYKRMEWDKPSPTITMGNGAISSQCNVHPGRRRSDGTYTDARALTVFELMRLMTLPSDWNIPDWATDSFIRKVIGEGIPPLIIKKIVKNINI